MLSRHLLPWTLASLALSCGELTSSEPLPSAERGASALASTFERAAAQYQLPVELLKSIAYVETRVSDGRGPSLTGGHGVMHLVEREDWRMLSRAAQLTGVDEEQLKRDPHANVEGAAAVLRELADQSFARYQELSPHRPEDFFHAVSLYSGIDSASLAQDYAAEVFGVMERGFSVSRPDGEVTASARWTDWRRHAASASRQDALGEYPEAYQWRATPNFKSGRQGYEYIVIHTTQGSYNGTLSWFQMSNSRASSHYVVRSSDGQITQMVEHQDTAWHASCYNPVSIGIEHEGYVDNPSRWYTDAMYEESAKLTRWIADRHGIPKNRSRIIGHVEVAPNCNRNGHYDPGSGWNWTRYMGLVQGTEPTRFLGKLLGVVYQKGNTQNRVAGASVTVNGVSKTTGADGSYWFLLPPGVHTVKVSKPGYQEGSVTKLVDAKTTLWGSVEINVPTSGKLMGKVYEYNPNNPGDTSRGIAGATVTVGGKALTTSSNGFYEVSLPAGSHSARITHPHYLARTVTRTVTAHSTVWGSAGLSKAGAAHVQPVSLDITFPSTNSEFDVAMQVLTGTVSDEGGALESVSVRINGGAVTDVAVVDGTYQVPIKLQPGMNVLEVSAKGRDGQVVVAKSEAVFHSGLMGRVHAADLESQGLQAAKVELLDTETAEVVASVTTDAQGAFSVSAPRVPADYVMVVRKDGFLTASETISIPDDRRLQVLLPLTEGSDPVPETMTIEFAEPVSGATVQSERVVVYGTVVGMQVTSVMVQGVAAERLGAGGFSASVPLSLGENVLEAVAKGVHGESASARLTVHREAISVDGSVASGCSTGPGLWLWGCLALIPWLGRRRR